MFREAVKYFCCTHLWKSPTHSHNLNHACLRGESIYFPFFSLCIGELHIWIYLLWFYFAKQYISFKTNFLVFKLSYFTYSFACEVVNYLFFYTKTWDICLAFLEIYSLKKIAYRAIFPNTASFCRLDCFSKYTTCFFKLRRPKVGSLANF